MPSPPQDFVRALAEARAYLRITAPFFASLCSSSPITACSDIETACVNEEGSIRVNPAFFLSLGVTERGVLLAHEIMHPAWGVFWRSKTLGHDPRMSNIAHDHVVNLILEDSYPGWRLPGWLCDPKYGGMSYEEVYASVSRSTSSSPPPGGQSSRTVKTRAQKNSSASTPPTTGWDIRPDGAGPMDPMAAENMWRERVVGAFQAAKAMGNVSASIERAVTDLLEPSLDWRDSLFLAVCETLTHSRVDWSMPSRRSDALNLHVPTEESLGYDVSIAVDTSGSVSAENIRRACSEIQSIVESAGASGRFLVGDAAVHRDIPLREFDATLLEGGGGTDFVPVFEHLETHPTRLLIYFTDTFGAFPPDAPGYPVIWAVYKSALKLGAEVPFGDIVEIPDE